MQSNNNNNIGISLNKKEEYHDKNKIINNSKDTISWLGYDIENIKNELKLLKDEENELNKNLEPYKQEIKQLEEIEKRNLDKVHLYNEIKDSTQSMILKLAEYDGITIANYNKKIGLVLNDDEK